MSRKVSEKRALAAMDQYQQEFTSIQEITARRDSEIAEINRSYTELLSGPTKILEKAEDVVMTFAEQNKESLFDETKKTVDFGVGTISCKKSKGKIEFLKGFDGSKVIELIKKKFKLAAGQLLTRKVSLDKTALKKLSVRDLKAVGLKVTSEETISIKVVATV